MVVRAPKQKFKRREGLPPWPRAKKMESQPCCDLKIKFDESKKLLSEIKIPFTRITNLVEKRGPGSVPNLGLTNPENWLLSILITLFPV
jgi:hypothetical protein